MKYVLTLILGIIFISANRQTFVELEKVKSDDNIIRLVAN